MNTDFTSKRSLEWSGAPLVESKPVTAEEADEILGQWAHLSLRVCFAVGIGEIAWKAHSVGTLRNLRLGRWVHIAGQHTNMFSTDQYEEIVLTEDNELIGLRFRLANDAMPGFEIDLFIDKNDGLDPLALINKTIQ